jgi:hypothetical protein
VRSLAMEMGGAPARDPILASSDEAADALAVLEVCVCVCVCVSQPYPP